MNESGHAAPETAPVPPWRHLPRRYLALGLIIVVICLLGTLVLVRDNAGPAPTPTTEAFDPAPSSLVASLASVPESVFDTVGVSSPGNPITPLRPAGRGSDPLWTAPTVGDGARPVVFFYGAEFAPYAAAERWPLMLALSRFGAFHQLGADAVEYELGLHRPLDLHLLARRLHQRPGELRTRRALQRTQPDGGGVPQAPEPDRDASQPPSRPAARDQRRSRW